MPTLLTTSRMSPALAARVEASVRGGSRGGGEGRLLRQAVLGMRILLLLAIVAGIVALVRMRQRESDEVQRSREGLLAKVRAHATALAPEDRRAVARIEPWLVRGSGQYEGDVIAEELKGPGALASFLSRPLVYVHGPTAEFDGPSGIAAAAATSQKDAFLL